MMHIEYRCHKVYVHWKQERAFIKSPTCGMWGWVFSNFNFGLCGTLRSAGHHFTKTDFRAFKISVAAYRVYQSAQICTSLLEKYPPHTSLPMSYLWVPNKQDTSWSTYVLTIMPVSQLSCVPSHSALKKRENYGQRRSRMGYLRGLEVRLAGWMNVKEEEDNEEDPSQLSMRWRACTNSTFRFPRRSLGALCLS